jgi:hypothetical protein
MMHLHTPIQHGPTKSVALFTNARDESHIKEWAAHHLLIGFDHVVIFDHKSLEPLSQVFQHFDKRVITIPYKGENPVKIKLMNKAIHIARKLNVDWFIYLDADEFIILNDKFKGIKELLNKYKDADSLALNWLMFGTNNLVKDPEGLILDNYTKSELIIDKHVKTFVRPFAAINALTPHYYVIQDKGRMFALNRILDGSEPYSFNTCNVPYHQMSAFIAHYVYQSEETYVKRKVILPADDSGQQRENIIGQIHQLYNGYENMYPKLKYAENVNKFLQEYS